MSMEKKIAGDCAAILLSLVIGSASSIAAAAEVKEKPAPEAKAKAGPEVKAKASAQKISGKFTLFDGKVCSAKEVLGKAACELGAATMFPGATMTCTASNVKIDKDCKVVEADCSCTGTR